MSDTYLTAENPTIEMWMEENAELFAWLKSGQEGECPKGFAFLVDIDEKANDLDMTTADLFAQIVRDVGDLGEYKLKLSHSDMDQSVHVVLTPKLRLEEMIKIMAAKSPTGKLKVGKFAIPGTSEEAVKVWVPELEIRTTPYAKGETPVGSGDTTEDAVWALWMLLRSAERRGMCLSMPVSRRVQFLLESNGMTSTSQKHNL